MKAGPLRERVTIEKPVDTQDDIGGTVRTWETVATCWAAVEPLSGREFFAAQQVQASSTTRIRIRFREDITTKMRVRHDAGDSVEHYYAINAVTNIQARREQLQLMCTEREADGFQT